MFENFKIYETTFGGRPMTFETGKMCGLSNGSVLVRWGETVVLVNVTASAKPREGIDFFLSRSILKRSSTRSGRSPARSSSGNPARQTRRSWLPAWLTARSARFSPRTCAMTARSL